MGSTLALFIGITLAGLIVSGSLQAKSGKLRLLGAAAALLVLAVFFTLASFRHVGEDSIGVVSKSVGWKSLPSGKIIATDGEKGPQAEILPPGWQPWYWPFIYDIEMAPVVEIEEGQIGMLTAADGKPLPRGVTYAPPWEEAEFDNMLNAEYFLTTGEGYKGPQTAVLAPGKYRYNPKLFRMETAPVLTIRKAEVGVVKSNVGSPVANADPEMGTDTTKLVERGQLGIWKTPLHPGQYYSYSHSRAYEVEKVSTQQQIVRYTTGNRNSGDRNEETEIMVRTSDGFTFPVDVRVEYVIEPDNAPLLVASVADDQDGLRAVMNSAVRSIFRNNAENVKALDYVQQRSIQESQSLTALQEALSKIGVTIIKVAIGDVGDEATLGLLLKTQTDREIALQEQETFKVQQLAAEQEKELTRTKQEAQEEMRLATAKYEVQIAEADKEKQIIAAGAEAEAVKIKAEAQAAAYQQIAEQIGSGNAALIELLKIVGERNISITPRVMVVGGQGGSSGSDGQTTALIGTMLDTMVSGTDEKPAKK